MKDDKIRLNENIRPYIISLWNLLDSFITVLKAILLESLGTIEEPKMTLSDDGTENLSFSIPMYLKQNGQTIENPIWYNVKNGNLIANMRKLKVIFNPGTADEDIFDFLITKITETHEEGKLTCEIEAEGMPFHELGKLGTRISLSADLYYDEDNDWKDRKDKAKKESTQFDEEEPMNNIAYWNEKIGFLRWIDGEYHDPGLWYYEVLMDWSSYANADMRDSDKIYEEAYVSSWTVTEKNEIIPAATESYKEKYRMIETSNSNYYNITLDIAKEFGVFCRYKYEYDDNHHIIARKIIYYNNFINDKEGKIDFSYPFLSSQISREMDSTDIITKMYVDTVLDENILIEDISITNSNANLSKEDYLLNFDYLYSVGAIEKDLYNEIAKYEALMHTLNETIMEADDYLLKLNMRLPELEAAVTLAKAGKLAAINGIDETNALLEAISSSDGNNDGIISGVIRTGYLVANKNTNPLTYNISITEKGVIQNTIKMYDEYNYADPANPFDETNHKLVSTGWKYEYDEFGNLIKINNITKGSSDSNTVYLQYDYSPSLYYKRIINMWTSRLAKDEDIIDTNTRLIATINTNIANKKTARQAALTEKERIKLNFTKLMGPALREGKWTPENNLSYNRQLGLESILSLSDMTMPEREDAFNLFWDANLDDTSDLDIYYLNNLSTTNVGYPCVEINASMLEYILRHLNENLCVIYEFVPDSSEDESLSETIVENLYYYRMLGSQSEFVFINNGTKVFPAIIVKGEIIDLDYFEEQGYEINTFLGTVITELKENPNMNSSELNELYKITISSQYTINNWIELTYGIHKAVYPRFKINEKELILNLGENSYGTNLDVSFNNKTLDAYNDYYTFIGDDGYTTFISFKPTQLIFNGKLFSGRDTIGVFYYISTASTAYYLDAREVLKENSTPKVSYNASISVLNTNFMKTAYKKLNRIININDYELKFEDVLGYISSINLNLDAPWEDSIEVKNYKTKFEDLFSSIVASTESMQQNTAAISAAATALNRDGTIKNESLLEAIDTINLNYSFNNGFLSITNDRGIESLSDGGIIALRKGGLFTATDKDSNDEWIWNNGITPQGINALMITVGLLDTNKIIVLAGDLVKFLLNDSGLYAYKSLIEDKEIGLITGLTLTDAVDKKLYVVHNANGLFLRMEPGAKIVESSNGTYELWDWKDSKGNDIVLPIDRVEISWDGLVLRNYDGDKVFFADPDTGDLTIRGTLISSGGLIGDWMVGNGGLFRLHKEEEGDTTITAEITPEGMNLFDTLEVGAEFGVIINSSTNRFRAHNSSGNSNYLGFEKINRTIENDEVIISGTSLLKFEELNIKIDGIVQLKTGENNNHEAIYSNLLINNKINSDLLSATTIAIATQADVNLLSLEANKKYKLSAGGTDYIFTTPIDSTYESKEEADGGTDLSLITTGDKYKWNQAYTHAVTNKGKEVSITNNDTKLPALVKILTNAEGHVIESSAITKTDITNLGIPAQDTTYSSLSEDYGGTAISLVTTGEKYTWNHKSNLTLGTDSNTALRGDYGWTAYSHAVNKGVQRLLGLYQISTNAEGHVMYTVPVTKDDIVALGIPAQDTTYSNANSFDDGLMSHTDKIKLDTVSLNAQSNVIESISVDGTALTITNKAVDIDLSGKADASILSMIAPAYDPDTLYNIDDFCIYNNKLYKSIVNMTDALPYNSETIYQEGDWCTYEGTPYESLIDMSEGEQWNSEHWHSGWNDNNWTETTLMAELQAINT